MIHNATGSRIWRLLPQAKHLANNGWNIKIRGLKSGQTGGISQDLLDWADIVVTEMTYSPLFLKAIKKSGAKIVYELDDLMEKVPKLHPNHKDMNWWRTYLTFKCLTMADAITCTVDNLKQKYKWFNSNIHILPNYLDLEFWEKPYLPNNSNTIRIGWAGGTSHKGDLLYILPVMKRIVEEFNNIKFICCGYGGASSNDKWVEFNYGENLFKDFPKDKYEFSLGAPMEVWPSKLASLRFDIGLAPVEDNVFSRCKSNCKSQEYGINHIPGVYTKFLYHDAVKHGETGYLAENLDDWYKYLVMLIKEKNRRNMGEAAYKHIKKTFNFEDYAQKWAELYETLLAE